MKILMVSIPNHHFFQWVNQLKDSGHEVYWFDSTDGGPAVDKINWVNQIKGWKRKWKFPFKDKLKVAFPRIYSLLNRLNENSFTTIFEQKMREIQPDIVHCFEMNLCGLPILQSMQVFEKTKLVYSSWGSDMYYFQEYGTFISQTNSFLKRVDFLITDCYRDYNIAVKNGFSSQFMGVFPGNGGITIPQKELKKSVDRNKILIKGYESFGCKASKIIEAIGLIPLSILEDFEIVIYSADAIIVDSLNKNPAYKQLKYKVYPRDVFITNEALLRLMGEGAIHISNNISDGMPNTLLESMGMGAFPIQSNPGGASAEVIRHGENGFLIENPLDENEIANLITKAIQDPHLRKTALDYNVDFIKKKYDRQMLQTAIEAIYHTIHHDRNKEHAG